LQLNLDSSPSKGDNILTLILLSYHSGSRLSDVYSEFSTKLIHENIPFEMIIVDDHSRDNSFELAAQLAKEKPNVTSYRLAKNYTSPYGHFAGLRKSNGQCAVAITDDGQIPVDLVVKFYRQWQVGNKIVIGFRDSRHDGYFTDISASLYYNIMNLLSDVKFPKGGTDAMLIDRSIINLLNEKISHNNTSPIIEVLKLGFDTIYLPYDRPVSNNKSRWTLKKKLKYASDTFFSSSSLPIKIITWFGFLVFDFALLLGFVLLNMKVFKLGLSPTGELPTWTLILAFFCFFNGLVIFSIGIVAQYVWRIMEDVRGKRPYIIEDSSSKHANNP
jgi:polyisoprenyl-phosphate glycosyltransferase